jgi:hypothetical protein
LHIWKNDLRASKANGFNSDDDRMRVIHEQFGDWEQFSIRLKQEESQEDLTPVSSTLPIAYPKILRNILLSLANMYGIHGCQGDGLVSRWNSRMQFKPSFAISLLLNTREIVMP